MANVSKNSDLVRNLNPLILQAFRDAGGSAKNLFTINLVISCFYKDGSAQPHQFKISVPDMKTADMIRHYWINQCHKQLFNDIDKNSLLATIYKSEIQAATGSILRVIQGPPTLHYDDGHSAVLENITWSGGSDAE